jgi:hypothetical protein
MPVIVQSVEWALPCHSNMADSPFKEDREQRRRRLGLQVPSKCSERGDREGAPSPEPVEPNRDEFRVEPDADAGAEMD